MIFQLELLKKYLDIPGIDDYHISFQNKKCKLPTALVYPNRREIVIVGNKASLIRYALADLIGHEIAECEFYHTSPDFTGDSHLHPDFIEREFDMKTVIVDAINEEHD